MLLPGVEPPGAALYAQVAGELVGERLIAASQEVPRFGYRRIAAWLSLGESRVRRMWRALKLNIPKRRPRCKSLI